MDPHRVFKAYDVRGRSDTGEIDARLYELTGNAFAHMVNESTVAVGRDCRTTSDEYFHAITRGITAAGTDVVDLGEVPTDLVYYYSGAHQVAGAMITASHNPAEYNGLKLCRSAAAPVGEETGLLELRDAVLDERFVSSGTTGSTHRVDAIPGYIDHLFGVVEPESIGPLRVAVDGGNGMAGAVIGEVFKRLEASLEGLFLEPDGTFPNHPADPLVQENLADLIERVASGGFDLGVAFDGDADRAFFLDDKGEPLAGSAVIALIARQLLEQNPGETVVHNLITSRAVPELVSEAGGTPVRTRVGHSFIKEVMAETGAIFGGEHSGHYYFRDNYRADSGMMAMLVLLRVLTQQGRSLSELRKSVERYQSSGEVNFEVEDVQASMAAVEAAIDDAAVDRLDGLTVDYGKGWFNLRPSNTEPLLRLNVEASDSEGVAKMTERVRHILQENQ